jgi:DNA topoisomerase-1
MKLVIIESPGKIKKIEHILGSNFTVNASYGHIIDLDAHKMSVDFEHNFEPFYVVLDGKSVVIKNLKKCCKDCDDIYIASDEDREGEMIAWSLAKELSLNNPKRITFTSITEDVVLESLKHPRQIDQNLVNAQKARRIIDRIAGYMISPILQKQCQGAKSAGRVQSVIVRLIVDRENEIIEFFKTDTSTYFKITGLFNDIWNANLMYEKEIAKIKTYDETIKLIHLMSNSTYKIKNVIEKSRKQSPSPPFTTSTLQQEASKKFNMSAKQIMMAAQNLYEGGYITYMRTDSVHLSDDALNSMEKYITTKYGSNYHKRTQYKAKTLNTQEAHEAIRPSKIEIVDIPQSKKFGSSEIKIYDLIWKRSVASQMAPALYKVVIIKIEISDVKDYHFEVELEQLTFTGFLEIYGHKIDSDIIIPTTKTKVVLNSLQANQKYQEPPSRYSVSSLLNKIDPKNLNIGRPATLQQLIDKIQERMYVEITDIGGFEKPVKTISYDKVSNKITEEDKLIHLGAEKNKFKPTTNGIMVTEFLMNHFQELMDYKFTSDMEKSLDKIAEGKFDWINVVKTFYDIIVNETSKIKDIVYVDKNLKLLGKDKDGHEVFCTIARFGPVVKVCKSGKKFTFAPIKEPLKLETITLDQATHLLEYPIFIGKYKRKNVELRKGKYGMYLQVSTEKISLGERTEEDARKLTIDDIVKIIEEKNKNVLWEQKNFKVINGPKGIYIMKKIKNKVTNYGLPKILK